ncbi:MAG: cache domain-containing protein [Verrucomicrobia bacterium]|nr:cache domain-containing protein [Verrucomicrobiota bacterium]MBU4292137.1 cache domain-containing protein [Verrucomicrobiota bacterium]MBU4428934.1 cache domain-containing protein [Verrucomicrobiota bacterium]MBU4498480.1 cache domain-containing protein [Verrucomicrobiota bacterium]MCG2680793.1 cache domain-containing protein [Kiritimatiellia bacterium]
MTLALAGEQADQPQAPRETTAAPTIIREQMVKFVEEAAAYVKKVGREAALKEFSNRKGKFVREKGELYIYAYDFKCVCLAHGYTPDLVGRDLTEKKDNHGLLVIQQLRDTVVRDGKGFVEYGWTDPATGKEGRKLGYVVKVDDSLWLGSGIYL